MKTTYISLLRGINVSGQNLVKMDFLRKICENLGFEQVRTYLQSGNIVFQSEVTDCTTLADKLSGAIRNNLGITVPVMVFEADDWKRFVLENPLLREEGVDPGFLHLTILSEVPEKVDLQVFMDRKHPDEKITILGKVVYLYCPLGYGITKLSNAYIESRFKLKATTRNWKTCQALIGIAQA